MAEGDAGRRIVLVFAMSFLCVLWGEVGSAVKGHSKDQWLHNQSVLVKASAFL